MFDNGKQFDSDEFKDFWKELDIVKNFLAMVHSQSSDQVSGEQDSEA